MWKLTKFRMAQEHLRLEWLDSSVEFFMSPIVTPHWTPSFGMNHLADIIPHVLGPRFPILNRSEKDRKLFHDPIQMRFEKHTTIYGMVVWLARYDELAFLGPSRDLSILAMMYTPDNGNGESLAKQESVSITLENNNAN